MKKIMLIFAMITLTILAWIVVLKQTIEYPLEYKQHLKAAQGYEELEIYIDALAEYQIALTYDPDNIDIQKKIIDMNYCLEQYRTFEENALKYYGAHSDDYDMLETIVNYYKENNQRSEAISLIQAAIKENADETRLIEIYEEFKGDYTVITSNFDTVSEFCNGYAVVKKDGRFGLISEDGSQVIPTEYEKIAVFSDDDLYAPIEKEEKEYYIDKNENKRLDSKTKFTELGIFSQGLATAKREGKAVYINKEYQVSKINWEENRTMYLDRAAAKQNGKWGIINRSFQEVTGFQYEEIACTEFGYCSINDSIFVKQDGKYGMIDLDGNLILKPQFDDVKPFASEDQLAAVKSSDKWGFINKQGELVIDFQYEDAKSFTMNYGAIKKDGKWGYIDMQNEIIIEPTFEDAGMINNSKIAAVKNEASWNLIRMEFIY